MSRNVKIKKICSSIFMATLPRFFAKMLVTFNFKVRNSGNSKKNLFEYLLWNKSLEKVFPALSNLYDMYNLTVDSASNLHFRQNFISHSNNHWLCKFKNWITRISKIFCEFESLLTDIIIMKHSVNIQMCKDFPKLLRSNLAKLFGHEIFMSIVWFRYECRVI